MSFPSTDLEVKVMLPVSLRGSVSNACARYIWFLLSKSLRLQDDNQAAHQGASPNTRARSPVQQTPEFSALC
jgi:hypothetical protein